MCSEGTAKPMQPARLLNSRAYVVSLAVFSIVCGAVLPHRAVWAALHASMPISAQKTPTAAPVNKENLSGEFVGPVTDCDGDGVSDDSLIDFTRDGVADECVAGREEVPEPPFQQTYIPTAEAFYSRLPAVGWQAQYQCGDGLYNVTLSRPSENQFLYLSEGLQLTSDVVYDDLDPNLNQPLLIKDPIDGIRYRFQQENNGEFYEYVLSDYGGNVGLYVYQTGEQIVAVPCQLAP